MRRQTNRYRSEAPRLEDILAKLKTQLPDLKDRFAVRSLGVFGSYLHGANTRESDLDILVAFDRAPSMFHFLELQEELTDLLGVPVDLVMESALRPKIGERIRSEVLTV